jgi:hypothetical protein
MDKVQEIRIAIAPGQFQAMQADLAAILPAFGGGMPGRGAVDGPNGLLEFIRRRQIAVREQLAGAIRQ